MMNYHSRSLFHAFWLVVLAGLLSQESDLFVAAAANRGGADVKDSSPLQRTLSGIVTGILQGH